MYFYYQYNLKNINYKYIEFDNKINLIFSYSLNNYSFLIFF